MHPARLLPLPWALALVAPVALAAPEIAPAQAATPAPALPDGITSAMIEEGRKLYQGEGLCLACHGPDAKGGLGPDLTDQKWLHGTGSLTELIERIRTGVSAEDSMTGQIMPPKGGSQLTDEELKAVAAYVYMLSRGLSP